ncbi:MAG: hypothetical protein MUC48_21595, partial [Leptolyngbya sp. Prado105]|nr:hypothetical protein [Leptolyngbya sp. Prado105]
PKQFVYDEIDLLKAWRKLAHHTCDKLEITYGPEIPSTDAIDDALNRRFSLREAIVNWAISSGQQWDQTWLNIAEDAVRLMLTEVAERVDYPEDMENAIALLTTEKDVFVDLIDAWSHFELTESWSVDQLQISAQLVRQLLTAVRDRDDLTEASELIPIITPITVKATEPEVQLKSAIERYIAQREEGWHDCGIDHALECVTKLLNQMISSDEYSFSRGTAIFGKPNVVYHVDSNGGFIGTADYLKIAIEYWGTQQNADWAKDARLESVIETVRKVLKQYTIGKLGAYEALLGQTGIYRVAPIEESADLEQICPLQNWNRLVGYLESVESRLYIQIPKRTTIADRLVSALTIQNQKYLDQLKEFQVFQTNVIGYLRALALIVESSANTGTHSEKNARFRGVIALLETSIEKVQSAHSTFVNSYWWSQPDLFRSDYPVRPLLDKIREQEKQIKELKGEVDPPVSTSDDIIF